MKDDQTKVALLQWLIPLIMLLIVISVMMANFSNKSIQSAEKSVEENMETVAERYAARLNNELTKMTEASVPVGLIMSKYAVRDQSYANELGAALCESSDAYMLVMSDIRGNGYDQNGKEVSIKDTSYFGEVMETMNRHYLYTPDDGFTGQPAIISVVPLQFEGRWEMLCLYYSPSNFSEIIRNTEFDADAFYAIIDQNGLIMEKVGSDTGYLAGENLWDTIGRKAYQDMIDKFQVKIQNKSTGFFDVELDGENRRLIYTPLRINNWALVVGVNKSYVEDMEARGWKEAKQILIQLIIAVSIFLGVIVVVSIINKIRFSEKNKQLEEKADTDLLTGLNNKLATERKIKEYIATHPNEQAMMFVLDIDNFKKINDTLGHAFGDEVLRSLGHQIGSYFRVTDVIGRTGGDEFTIFLKNINSDELIEKEAKKVSDFFSNFQTGEYVKYFATASIGVAIFSRDGKDFESLYKSADQALYMAKKRGKNQLAFYQHPKE